MWKNSFGIFNEIYLEFIKSFFGLFSMSQFEHRTVGIILPVRNEEKNIVNCLQALDRQDYVKLKVFISDNNSNDQTRKFIEEIALERIEIETRIEPFPIKSVYAHISSAIEYFLKENKEIKYWVVLGADDLVIERKYIHNSVIDLEKEISGKSDDLALGIYPKVSIESALNRNLVEYCFDLQGSHSIVRMIKYYLQPRGKQPFVYFFSLFNSNGLREIQYYCNSVEKSRVLREVKNDRSPEFEMYYSIKLAGKINLKAASNSTLRYRIHFRKRSTILDNTSKNIDSREPLYFYQKVVLHTSSIFYFYFYYKRLRFELTPIEKFAFWALFPLKSLIEFWFNSFNLLERKLRINDYNYSHKT